MKEKTKQEKKSEKRVERKTSASKIIKKKTYWGQQLKNIQV